MSFAWELTQGALYSFLLSLESVLLCLPTALLGALILRRDHRGSRLILYAIDVFLALPNQILLLTLAGLLGGGNLALLTSVVLTQVPGILRHLRVQLRLAYGDQHVEAAVALGVGEGRVFLFHVLPRVWTSISLATLSLTKRVILMEALITFLGLASNPLSPSLGRLISEGRDALFYEPIYFIAPVMTLALCLMVLQAASDRFSSLFKAHGLRYL